MNHGQKNLILMVVLFVFIISSVVWLIPDIGKDHDKGSTSSELTVQETTEENVARTSYVDAGGNLTCAIDKHYATIVKTLDEEGRVIEEQYLDEQEKPTEVPQLILETAEEKAEWQAAEKRAELRKQRRKEKF